MPPEINSSSKLARAIAKTLQNGPLSPLRHLLRQELYNAYDGPMVQDLLDNLRDTLAADATRRGMDDAESSLIFATHSIHTRRREGRILPSLTVQLATYTPKNEEAFLQMLDALLCQHTRHGTFTVTENVDTQQHLSLTLHASSPKDLIDGVNAALSDPEFCIDATTYNTTAGGVTTSR